MLDYKINSQQRTLLRQVTSEILSADGNAYDVAIAFMIGQLNAFSEDYDDPSHTLKIAQYVAEKNNVLSEMNFEATVDWHDEIRSLTQKYVVPQTEEYLSQEENAATPESDEAPLILETPIESHGGVEGKDADVLELSSDDFLDGSSEIVENSIVYVLSRDDNPNLCKVGSTKNSAALRAANYTDGGWTVFFEKSVPKVLQFPLERYSHSLLKQKGYWLDPKVSAGSARELFVCSPELAVQIVNQAWDDLRLSVAEQIGSILPETETKSKLEHQFLISAKAELDENIQDEGLWLQCFTDARGNSEIAKAFYLRRRGLALKNFAEAERLEAKRLADEAKAKRLEREWEEEERQYEIKRRENEKKIADEKWRILWGIYPVVFLVFLLVLFLMFASS